MARNPDWSDKEVELVVSDYFEMLRKEMNDIEYNKSEHRERLIRKLNDRSKGSIEFKHCNISAALVDLGLVSIDGYKPRPHKQQTLVDSVNRYLDSHPDVKKKLDS